jgi:hypothetical protein
VPEASSGTELRWENISDLFSCLSLSLNCVLQSCINISPMWSLGEHSVAITWPKLRTVQKNAKSTTWIPFISCARILLNYLLKQEKIAEGCFHSVSKCHQQNGTLQHQVRAQTSRRIFWTAQTDFFSLLEVITRFTVNISSEGLCLYVSGILTWHK